MELGQLPVPGRPTVCITVGQGPSALTVGAGGGCLDIFTLIYPFSPLSPSLWETARYRLKYCLKGPLNPKQPTNQPRHVHFCTGGYGEDSSRLRNFMGFKLVTNLKETKEAIGWFGWLFWD